MFPVAPVPVICGKLEGNAGTISLGCWAPLDAWAWTGFGASYIVYKKKTRKHMVHAWKKVCELRFQIDAHSWSALVTNM